MKRLFFATLVALSCATQSATLLLPSSTQVVNSLAEGDSPREGFSRLRLNLSSSEPKTNESVQLAGVAACSDTICYESSAPSRVKVSTTADGTSTPIVNLEVPLSTIRAIRFKYVDGQNVLHGSIALPQALILEPSFKGGDIMVVIQRRSGAGARSTFEPIAAAANYLPQEGSSIYYNPSFETRAKLASNASIVIPSAAYHSAQIFVVAVHDTGEDFPMVDIYPEVKLAKAATVQLNSLERVAAATVVAPAQPTPAPRAASPAGSPPLQLQALRNPTTTTFEILSTGVIRNDAQGTPKKGSSNSTTPPEATALGSVNIAATCNSAGWCNCAEALANQTNQQIITDGLTATGAEYLDWCTTIAPFAHIAISNLADAREQFTVRHDNKVVTLGNIKQLPLRRLTSWAAGTQIMINGFTWEGQDGTALGQTGLANGFVHDFSTGLGDNIQGGGACGDVTTLPCSSLASGGNKLVMFTPRSGSSVTWAERSDAAVISNSLSYVSSSTSIVKNGQCATDSLKNRWSAIGATTGGRVIFISSTSAGETTAAELCQVFKSLGAINAIRLDGGPSAAMTIDGVLKNPLTGLFALKYGSSRYVAYGLKAAPAQ